MAKTTTARKPRASRKSTSADRADGAARTNRLRKAVLAEINGNLDHADPKPAKAPKEPKAPKALKPKRVSALGAAATVLASAGRPMGAKDMIDAMATQGLWTSPGGKTPASTLYAAITREIATKGAEARFRKTDRGLFEATAAAA